MKKLLALTISTTKEEKKVQVLEHYKKILKNSDEVLALLDSKFQYLMQNSGHAQLFGFTDDDLKEKTPAIYMGSLAFVEMTQEMSEKQTYHGELITKMGPGSEKQIELSVFPIFDETGTLNAYFLVHRDISQRMLDNERFHLSTSVLGHTLKGIVVTDPMGHIVLVNPTFTRITGYRFEEVVGKTTEILYSGFQGLEYFRAMWNSLVEKGQWQGEIWSRRKDGEIYPESLEMSAIKDKEGVVTHYVGLFSDITKREISESRYLYLTRHDVLTNLPNRRLLDDRLVQALKQADRQQKKLAILHVDLDHFSKVNESFGPMSGDRLLVEIGRRLKKCVRDCDTVSHFSDNTFVILLTESSEIEHTATIAKKILNLISKPILLGDHPVMMSGSIGISLYPEDGSDSQSLLDHAESAMDRVKLEGRNGYQFYSGDMDAQTLERIELKMAMQRAVERNEFLVYYQPQVNLDSGHVFCIEALLRWQHPERGLISPPAFIPMAEETSLILPIGEWVLRTACRQLNLWQKSGLPSMRIAVNLSALQFQQESLPDLVREILHETKIDPSALELEITESSMMDHIDKGIETMNRLQSLGVRLAVDDFGIGYSSIGYLRQFPIHTLKVDQSFVKALSSNSDDAAMTAAIIAMAQNLNLDVVAEGVETDAQLRFLLEHRCSNMQGYYFSRPLPAEGLRTFLAEKPYLGN